eukprot:96459_1
MEICFPSSVGDQDDCKNPNDTTRFCEVQAIILAHYSTYDIHPLLQNDTTGKEKAKFLLPFANRAIITYPLRLLEIHGFTEILVVITDDFAEDMVNFLATYKHYAGDEYVCNITPVTVNEEDLTEIQVLKQIHRHIKTDFLVMRCDIFTNAPLGELLRIHRRENSSITLLLSKQITKTKQQQGKKKAKKSKNTHIIGTDFKHHQQLVLKGHPKEIERLWYMKARADLEDEDTYCNKNKHDEPQLTLDKRLLDYIPYLRFTTKLKIQQVGIFCRWILLWILEDAPKEYELLYEEAVPHLIDMQTEINHMTFTATARGDNLDDIQSTATDESSNTNKLAFDFPDLIRRSSNVKDKSSKSLHAEEVKSAQPKLGKQKSHYASGIFLSHMDVLGNDYMASTANASNSSLPRTLIMTPECPDDNRSLRGFDDAKSDITAISMSAMSTAVNAPTSPRENVEVPSRSADIERVPQRTPLVRKSSPLSQRIGNLPSPEHLATVEDPDDLPKITQQFLRREKSEYMSVATQDKLKIFGYVYGEDNDNGLFSCIINNSDRMLSLSMSLMRSVMSLEKKLEQKQKEEEARQFAGKKSKQKRDQGNEERDAYFEMKEYENNALLYLILRENALEECRIQNGEANIKNGCIIAPNCIIGAKTRCDKCVLQPFVNIGKNCKIINCVILAHVTIGDNCKISNSIISTHANIADACDIRNCKIADRVNIAKGSNFKNETLQSGALYHGDDSDDENGDVFVNDKEGVALDSNDILNID